MFPSTVVSFSAGARENDVSKLYRTEERRLSVCIRDNSGSESEVLAQCRQEDDAIEIATREPPRLGPGFRPKPIQKCRLQRNCR